MKTISSITEKSIGRNLWLLFLANEINATARDVTGPTEQVRLMFRLNDKDIKVARSDFCVTIPFNFERLEQHHYQSNRKPKEKDESFKWSTFHQNLSYHSKEMTLCPILHKTE